MDRVFHNVAAVWDATMEEGDREAVLSYQRWLDDGDLTRDEVERKVRDLAWEVPGARASFAYEVGPTATLLGVARGKVHRPVYFELRPVLAEPAQRFRFPGGVPDAVATAITAAEDATGRVVEYEIDGDVLVLAGFTRRAQIAPVLEAIAAAQPTLIRSLTGYWQASLEGYARGWVRVTSADGRLVIDDAELSPLEHGTAADVARLHWTFDTSSKSPRTQGLVLAAFPV